MFWIFLVAAQLSSPDFLALKNQVKCEVGCQAQNYDTGLWLARKKTCLCADVYHLPDLFLKKYTVPPPLPPPSAT